MKKFMLLIAALLLVVASVSFAQQACNVEGQTQCVDNFDMRQCTNGVWITVACPLGCDWSANACFAQNNGQSCQNIGQVRCDPNSQSNLQVCDNNHEWSFAGVCDYTCDNSKNQCYECDATSSPYCSANLQSSYSCNGNPGYFKATACQYGCDSSTGLCKNAPAPCNAGDVRCNGDNLEVCNGNGWSASACSIGCYQQAVNDAYCKQCAAPGASLCVTPSSYETCGNNYVYGSPVQCASGTTCQNGACVPQNGSSCTPGEQLCLGSNGKDIYTCTNTTGSYQYNYDKTCASDEVCVKSGSNAYCQKIVVNPSSGSSGSSSGSSGLVGSGGGEISRCSQYGDWVVKEVTEFTREDSTGSALRCANTTRVSYCLNADGTYDYTDYKTNSSVECTTPNAPDNSGCTYVYDRSTNYTDTSAGACRDCTKDIYVYSCNGQRDATNTKESVSCSDFHACPAATAPKSGLDAFLNDYGIALGFVLLLLIAIIAFVAWKMMDDSDKPQDGENGPEGPDGQMGQDGQMPDGPNPDSDPRPDDV